MADQCISVKFEGDKDFWEYCWEDATPYPGWDFDNVTTGLRPGLAGGARAWRSCQYFMKGMPSTCAYWKEVEGSEGVFRCTFKEDNTSENPNDPKPKEPTGYNFGQCDFLGRRSWCNSYTESVAFDPDLWICTAPNPYLTGYGVKSVEGQEAFLKPRSRAGIWGYNDAKDGTGTGRCDCAGFGRGKDGCKIVGTFTGETTQEMEDALSKLPIVCNLYRPYSMGFGIIEPAKKQAGDVEADGITITEQGWKNSEYWEKNISYRLPLSYKLYNKRAEFQKCQWWEEEGGRSYFVDSTGTSIYLDGDPDIFDSKGRVEFCKCTDPAAVNYNTRILETLEDTSSGTGAQMALDGVWAKGGGPVCNGCRPECPCYSGKWTYLTSERMYPGMAVTANQILELRFWEQEWDSYNEYKDYYMEKPNWDDPETEAIYTFTKWVGQQDGADGDALAAIDITTSKMTGKRLTLCVPTPLNQREFSGDVIVSEDSEYWHYNIGTSSEGGQRHFPNLIRDPDFGYLKPLTVVYPPMYDDPFGPLECPFPEDKEKGYTKRSNDVTGDRIKTIGYTFANKNVYVFNTEHIPFNTPGAKFPGVYAIKSDGDNSEITIKNDLYNELREQVAFGFENAPEYINFATSDSAFGFFTVDPVKLDYGKKNLLIIAVDYGDGTWEYRKRIVKSKWYGGVVKQTSYEHIYGSHEDGYSNPQPQFIGSSSDTEPAYGEATADLVPLGEAASATESPEIVSTFSLDDIWRGLRYFDYAYEVFKEEDVDSESWGAIGNTNKILLAVGDLNVNYIYDWTIDKAVLEYSGEDEDKEGTSVELKVLLVDDNYLGPDYCVLEPKDDIRIRFFNSDWDLIISYRYIKPNNSPSADRTSIWGAGRTANDIHATTPHKIEQGGFSISVSKIDRGSVQFLTHFKDEDGRNINAFATKLLLQIVNESCRSVDIFYKYSALGKEKRLNPYSGQCIRIEGDTDTGEFKKHVEIPNCGDHEYSVQKWEGPMWFPFNSCRGYDMYDEFTICNNCQAGYVGPQNAGVARDENGEIIKVGHGTVITRNDYRYCGPHKYISYGKVRGSWIQSCDCGCSFSYSDATSSQPIFIGYGNIKTTVDIARYYEYGWELPPFGNEGRELIEKYISQDYVTHLIPQIVNGFKQRADWMPLMIDYDSFHTSFDAYDTDEDTEYIGITPGGFEPFRYTQQMTMHTLPSINEKLDVEEDEGSENLGEVKRYEWEELFELHFEGNCSYPLPTYPAGTSATKAAFYYLKKPWGAWAWQENWEDIERNIESEMPPPPAEESDDPEEEPKSTSNDQLGFLTLKKPRYIIDFNKQEHRRIVEEGYHRIKYDAPVMDEEGNLEKWPKLALDGGVSRSFEIFYDENSYTAANPVKWLDEGGQSDNQGSSDEDNIYEEASGSDWLIEDNMLFDEEASGSTSTADAAGRKIVSGLNEGLSAIITEYTYQYFNRGIIAEMTRDKLYNLPKDLTPVIMEFDTVASGSTPQYKDKTDASIPGTGVWEGEATLIFEWEEPIAISSLLIKGNWGFAEGSDTSEGGKNKPKTYQLIRPGVGLTATFVDDSTGPLRGFTTNATRQELPPEGLEVETYEIYLNFLLGPIEMIKKKVKKISVTLSGRPSEFISLVEASAEKAEYIDMVYEDIYTWERKYVASSMADVTGAGINLDGPGENLHYDNDLWNMGQYYNFRAPSNQDKKLSAMDKTKIIGHDVAHDEDERLTSLDYNTLKFIEKYEQKTIYENMLKLDPTDSDVLIYEGFAPYKLEAFLSNLGYSFPTSANTIESHKLIWEKHKRVKSFKQYDFWRPGGHKYEWNTDKIVRLKCRLFDPPEDFFEGKYRHIDHKGVGTPISADPETPVDPGNSYYSLRFYTQQAKYDRAMILGGGEPEYSDKWGGVFGPIGSIIGGA